MSKQSTPSVFPQALIERLSEEGLLAVLTIEDPDTAVPLSKALVEGGVRAMELAWRTPATMECLEKITAEVPEMIVGIGTILNKEQLHKARQNGAAFGVSPGYSRQLVSTAFELEFPYAPGVMTPSDIQEAVQQGCQLLKYFPAESAGGIKHLRTMNAPFAHLNLRYIILGGLTEDNADGYLKEPCVSVLGGSWIAPKELIEQRDWNTIRQRASRARQLWENMRGKTKIHA
jgi:2-dehydro-3-deoxyphosphogluconate aldolase/(4S)-4-hydroxy-2-oxoglutarate aldolase